MVGKILAVKVEPGAAVKQGDLLFLLEAMKMENEITSPAAGTIASIAVEEGSSVKQGDLLCVIEP
jgi:biotin carboxyl carrier protein